MTQSLVFKDNKKNKVLMNIINCFQHRKKNLEGDRERHKKYHKKSNKEHETENKIIKKNRNIYF